MRRGDIVIATAQGDYGKPRPFLVLQTDALLDPLHASVVLCLITKETRNSPILEITIEPTAINNLQHVSFVFVDKIVTLRPDKIKAVMGNLENEHMREVEQKLRFLLSL
ncbi:MAG: type II toxin-antitoxin system PemK/MazF family toxin [Alphaproteobacteria bacterium]|jgi:mRNA interferase MazF|nr:type II toxin-antitoxin system PemK/MazF family toxin [Alphaproteobacteria bacterium]